jgi:hypothetical protein
MEQYDRQNGFTSEEDSQAFFRFIMALHVLKGKQFKTYAVRLGVPDATVLATILAEAEEQ